MMQLVLAALVGVAATILSSHTALAQNQFSNNAENQEFEQNNNAGNEFANQNSNQANNQNQSNNQNSNAQEDTQQNQNGDQNQAFDDFSGNQQNANSNLNDQSTNANILPINQAMPLNQAAPLNQAPLNLAPMNQAPVNQAQSSTPLQDQATPAAPSEPCTPKCEMLFHFDQYGTPGVHSFLLHWDHADGNLLSIEVLVAETKEVIQKLDIPQDSVHLIYKELLSTESKVKDKFIDSLDYNFDKASDLRLLRKWPYIAGDKYYFVWLFDEQTNKYVLHEALSALQNPQPNSKTERIEAVTLGGWAGGEYTRRIYEISPEGHLRVLVKVMQTMLEPKPLTFIRDVRERVNGDLQRVCKIRVPAEGRARRITGNAETCDKYMTKETPKR